MQKKIVALAVAGLSTAAFAQTNVTIYGVADVSGQGYNLAQSKAGPKNEGGAQGNVFSVQSNASLLGFKGTEDLGNGLKALFQAETELNLTGGAAVSTSSSLWAGMRDSYIGLGSKYGTVLGGFLSTPFRSTLTSFDVMPGATGSGGITQIMGGMRISEQGIGQLVGGSTGLAFAAPIRAQAIAYAMPTLYGFDASIAYTGSANNGQGNNSQLTSCSTTQDTTACTAQPQSVFGFNLGWTGYGVSIKGAFQQANNNFRSAAADAGTVGAAGAVGDFTSYLVGAMYTGLPGLKLSTAYGRNTLGINGGADGSEANKLTNNQLWAGASYRMGNWEPRLSAVWSSNVNGMDEVNQLGARQWTANVGYYLSKRTQVYGLISNLNNSANANYRMGQQTNNMVPTGGENLFTYGMGMRTTF